MNRKLLLTGACIVATVAAIAAYALIWPDPDIPVTQSASVEGNAMVAIRMPPIDGKAATGQQLFNKSCAACHGVNAAGNEGVGPPLVHVIYEPSHHADEAFQRAVVMGVRSHHWRFGDMPPVVDLTRNDVAMIIAYIREIQRANGIE